MLPVYVNLIFGVRICGHPVENPFDAFGKMVAALRTNSQMKSLSDKWPCKQLKHGMLCDHHLYNSCSMDGK